MLARREDFEMADEDAWLESRVAKVESDVAHIASTVAVVQIDLRELRREVSDGFKTLEAKLDGKEARLDDKIEALRKGTDDGFKILEARLDGKIEALRKETGEGFKEARKNLRTDLGLFLAGLSLLLSAGLGIAALVFKA